MRRYPVRVNLDITEGSIMVGRDSDVHGLDGPEEGLVKIFFGHLKLEKGAVNLVDDDNGLDTLAQCLPEDGLGSHTDTLDAVYDNKSTACRAVERR
jgi:hypothetical protein